MKPAARRERASWTKPGLKPQEEEESMTKKKPSDLINLTRQFAFDCKFAEERLLEDGTVGQMFLLHHAGGVSAVPGAWKDEQEKGAILGVVRLLAIALDARAATIIAEAWMVSHESGTQAADWAKLGLKPSQSDRRVEIVMVILSGFNA